MSAKRCACGVEYDTDGWAAMPFVGEQTSHGERYELRNCTACSSTVTRCFCERCGSEIRGLGQHRCVVATATRINGVWRAVVQGFGEFV